MGRPNELTGQVRPNTLSSQSGRRQTLGLSSPPPGWTSRGPTSPTATRPPAPPTASYGTAGAAVPNAPSRPAARRPTRVWALLVLAVVIFNLLPRILASGFAFPGPTTEPALATPGEFPTSGVVEFGTAQNENCTLKNTGDIFGKGIVGIFWFAQFSHPIPATARIEYSLTHNGATIDSGSGPLRSPPGPWSTLCGSHAEMYTEPGAYTLQVRTADGSELLSVGTYELQ